MSIFKTTISIFLSICLLSPGIIFAGNNKEYYVVKYFSLRPKVQPKIIRITLVPKEDLFITDGENKDVEGFTRLWHTDRTYKLLMGIAAMKDLLSGHYSFFMHKDSEIYQPKANQYVSALWLAEKTRKLSQKNKRKHPIKTMAAWCNNTQKQLLNALSKLVDRT